MSPDEDVNQTNGSSEFGATGPVGGERLAEARRTRGISVHEIAKELHLDEAKVRALEENSFDVLGAPVFAKGHLRKYAELVGVLVDDVLADYYRLNRSAGAPPVVGPPRKLPREISFGPWFAGIVVVLVVAIGVWWWTNLKPTAEPVTVQPEPLAPVESESAREPAADVEESAAAVDDGATADMAESSEVAVVETAPEAERDPGETVTDDDTVVGETSVELVLSFSGDCWTEVTDATGRRLYFDLGTDGRTVTLNGVEPLGVLLGNSSNVSVRVNGFDYIIPAANRRGDTARLTIYGQ